MGAAKNAVEHMKFDLALVTTYLPILSLCSRATVLVCTLYLLRDSLLLPPTTILMVAACLVFLDSWHFQHSVFDHTCGHLFLCALAVLTQQTSASNCMENVHVLRLIIDFVWCLLASFELCSSIWNLRIKLSMLLKVLIVQCMAVAHVMFSCGINSHYSILETLLRVVLYYVMTAVVILSGPYLAGADKTHYRVSVPLVCCQLLFVHIFSLLANILVLVVVHTRFVCAGVQATDKTDEEQAMGVAIHQQASISNIANISSISSISSKSSKSSITQAMHDSSENGEQKQLLAMLLAAKKQNNLC